ncbi:MAG TPA: glycogen debranching enzyme N-terminal domain-containing protein, partial [Terriglobales bacterium]|nr:glycogen debranching enzyme N-terminal domain-containing protein [Terriglobales bacterium]
MRLGQDVLSDPARALAAEWLLPNGVGGSSSGTVAGTVTRDTQGLLVAGASGRPLVLLLRLDERASGELGAFDLACAPAAGPASTGGAPRREAPWSGRAQGRARLEEFRLDPWPVWLWNAAGTLIEKTLFTISGHDAIAIAYRHLAGPPVHLAASPLCVARGPGAPPGLPVSGAIQGMPGRVRIELAAGAPSLSLWHNGTFLPARVWVRGLACEPDPRARGGAAPRHEDALVPGHAEGLLAPGRFFHLVFAAEDGLFRALAAEERLGVPPPRTLADCVAALEESERDRLARWRRGALDGADFTTRQAAAAHGGSAAEIARRREPLVRGDDATVLRLACALRGGLVRRGSRRTFVSSLPGGAERGVEVLQSVQTLITLRGFDLARDILRGYLEYLDEGLAPVGFDAADGRPLYGGPATSLWLVAAGDLYARRSGDRAFLGDVLHPALEGVMQALRQGTRHGVRTAPDGLLVSGAADLPKDEGAARGGGEWKVADLNALWYHALVAMAQLSRQLARREHAAFYLAWAHEHQKRFLETFWDAERACLHDAIGESGPLHTLSPSQLLAVSLPPALLAP